MAEMTRLDWIATWTSRQIAAALGHRSLRIEIGGGAAWRVTVRSMRRVVYRDESASLALAMDRVAAWCAAGCPEPPPPVEPGCCCCG